MNIVFIQRFVLLVLVLKLGSTFLPTISKKEKQNLEATYQNMKVSEAVLHQEAKDIREAVFNVSASRVSEQWIIKAIDRIILAKENLKMPLTIERLEGFRDTIIQIIVDAGKVSKLIKDDDLPFLKEPLIISTNQNKVPQELMNKAASMESFAVSFFTSKVWSDCGFPIYYPSFNQTIVPYEHQAIPLKVFLKTTERENPTYIKVNGTEISIEKSFGQLEESLLKKGINELEIEAAWEVWKYKKGKLYRDTMNIRKNQFVYF